MPACRNIQRSARSLFFRSTKSDTRWTTSWCSESRWILPRCVLTVLRCICTLFGRMATFFRYTGTLLGRLVTLFSWTYRFHSIKRPVCGFWQLCEGDKVPLLQPQRLQLNDLIGTNVADPTNRRKFSVCGCINTHRHPPHHLSWNYELAETQANTHKTTHTEQPVHDTDSTELHNTLSHTFTSNVFNWLILSIEEL